MKVVVFQQTFTLVDHLGYTIRITYSYATTRVTKLFVTIYFVLQIIVSLSLVNLILL